MMRFLAFVLLLLPLLPAPVLATDLPGGKANYVVTLGRLRADVRDNWVRLGTYQFATDGTITARTYLWWQTAPAAREGTGTTPDLDSCSTVSGAVGHPRARHCEVLTAGGFMDSPPESRTGTFNVAGDVLNITWNFAQAWSEQWYLRPNSDGTLVRLESKYNTFATHAYGYGSNAALSTRRAMSTVQAFPGTLKQDLASWTKENVTTSTGQVFTNTAYHTCTTTTWCLTYAQPSSASACQASGGCPNYGGGTPTNDSSIQYYLAKVSSNDRRDTLWHWCTCLAREHGEFCYTGNSHVKPLLQILDDDGGFHGWVGAEASFYPLGSDPRYSDMLGVFRLTDTR
ncbi:hypothetical protein [Nonomuraea aurantiaca]|uniref:hypothetical protein n=1 Tax=Nonomuraea aurantiaca TaxID=2878562 RepID=UPI001CDA3FC6|nr:hypothetical protein [Nonomuraea aurantiaca]MCA2227771.1 hypothetical protein [Nonomuraea aurantiaca]